MMASDKFSGFGSEVRELFRIRCVDGLLRLSRNSRIGPALRNGLCGLAVICVALPGLAQAQRPVMSLLEKREERVVIQNWDVSCGAAALATILNYQLGDPISEREIAEALIERDEYLADPDLVLARQGFSLLDLKRFVDERGYEGTGFGNLEFQDLIDLAPIMVAVDFNNYPHFVVFRGARGNRVLLADPAFGNRTMLIGQFEAGWTDYPDFGRVGFVVTPADGTLPPNRLAPRSRDFVSLR